MDGAFAVMVARPLIQIIIKAKEVGAKMLNVMIVSDHIVVTLMELLLIGIGTLVKRMMDWVETLALKTVNLQMVLV